MYSISTHEKHMLVKFEDHFGHQTIRSILKEQLHMPEYPDLHDIWLIDKHHAQISLGELLAIVEEFPNRCAEALGRKKIALTVKPGRTEPVVKLLARGINRKFRLECEVFYHLTDAENWLAEPA